MRFLHPIIISIFITTLLITAPLDLHASRSVRNPGVDSIGQANAKCNRPLPEMPKGLSARDLADADVMPHHRALTFGWMVYENKPKRKFKSFTYDKETGQKGEKADGKNDIRPLSEKKKLHPEKNFRLQKKFCDTVEIIHKDGKTSVMHWGYYANDNNLVFFFDGCNTFYCLLDFTLIDKVSDEEKEIYGSLHKTGIILFSYFKDAIQKVFLCAILDRQTGANKVARLCNMQNREIDEEGLLQEIKSSAKDNPLHVWATGFSAGGAMAKIAAYSIKYYTSQHNLNAKVMELHTFGAPKVWSFSSERISVLNEKEWFDESEWVHYRWVQPRDFAPSFSGGFYHDVPYRMFNGNGDVFYKGKKELKGSKIFKLKYKEDEANYGSNHLPHALGKYLDLLENL